MWISCRDEWGLRSLSWAAGCRNPHCSWMNAKLCFIPSSGMMLHTAFLDILTSLCGEWSSCGWVQRTAACCGCIVVGSQAAPCPACVALWDAAHVCRQVTEEKKERKIQLIFLYFFSLFFLFSFRFNAQTGNLCSSSSNMLMQAFIAIDFSKTECMLTILMDPGQEKACLVTLDKAYQN